MNFFRDNSCNPWPPSSQFLIKGSANLIVPFGNGHIHKTFRIINSDNQQPDYLLQKINHLVFKDIEKMMNNILKVTKYINSKGSENYSTLSIIPDHEGAPFHVDSEGQYWRMYYFHKELDSYEIPHSSDQIYEGARAFGKFVASLSEFPSGDLHPVIPDFHNLLTRLKNLESAAGKDEFDRKKEVHKELKYIFEVAPKLSELQVCAEKGEIPMRVTHNDAKFNNVLFDKSGKARCVVDLDTVMPGLIHYDFGDGVRTTVSESPEDEASTENIQVNLERFRAYANGYLDGLGGSISDIEMEYLPYAGPYMSFIMGVRFLTDYLRSDVYFKIDFPGHNIQRARAQLELTRKLLERIDDLKQIIIGRK